MNSRLAEALNLLQIKSVEHTDDAGNPVKITPKEHAMALVTYLNMGNYLSESLIEKAVSYLSVSKPFARGNAEVIADLNQARKRATVNGQFYSEIFIREFAKQDYFTTNDIIDLLTFLQQTAFDRQFGVERDKLPPKHWLTSNPKDFLQLARFLDVVSPKPPQREAYTAVAIMGAASSRVTSRMDYFSKLNVQCGYVWALSGNRELSKGLDDETVMSQVAEFVGKPVNYVEKPSGTVTRVFLDGVTETMMVNFLIKDHQQKINVVDSAVQADHWRATTSQNAVDVAKLFLTKLETNEIPKTQDGRYFLTIIAEQPYSVRMAKQVQREFDKEIKRQGLTGKISVVVEGCGRGLQEDVSNDELLRVDSELGALMAERFHDARLAQSGQEFRDAGVIMFSNRDNKFLELQAALESKPSTSLRV